MMKYAGTSVSSKNKKNRTRSSEMKLPMQAASRRSIHAMKGRASALARAPAMAMGKSTAAISTKKIEMPSTPTNHDTPIDDAHTCLDTN